MSEDLRYAPGIEMPKWKSHKTVYALEIKQREQNKLIFADAAYAPIEVDPKVFSRYEPVQGDYLVVYADGYQSISPRAAFLDGYTRHVDRPRVVSDFNTAAAELFRDVMKKLDDNGIEGMYHGLSDEDANEVSNIIIAVIETKLEEVAGQKLEKPIRKLVTTDNVVINAKKDAPNRRMTVTSASFNPSSQAIHPGQELVIRYDLSLGSASIFVRG